MKGSAEQLSDVSHIQSSHQIEAVDFDGPDADLQHIGYFPVRMSDRHQAKNVSLARRQRVEVSRLFTDRFGLTA